MISITANIFDYMSLKEYRIEHDDYYGQCKMIRSIYKSANLVNDPYWHYFLEIDYLLIRVQDKSCKRLETTLKRRKLEYKKFDAWDEACSNTAIKFIDFFGPYFHLISRLTMEEIIEDDEENKIIERVFHCLNNHFPSIYKGDTVRLFDLMSGIFYGLGIKKGKKLAMEKKDE